MAAERAWKGYKDDTGVIWNAFVGLGNQSGFVGFSAARAPLPRMLKMRYCTCQAATTGRKRKLLVGDVTNAYWTGAATSFGFVDEDGNYVLYTVTGRVGERWTRLPH